MSRPGSTRVLIASNSRTYRLVLLDDQGANVLSRVTQIGIDGGLLDAAGIAARRRADPGRRGAGRPHRRFPCARGRAPGVVNSAAAPFKNLAFDREPAAADADHRLPYPQVMEFRGSSDGADDRFVMTTRLSSFRRWRRPAQYEGDLAAASIHRMIALVKHEIDGRDMFMLRELESAAETAGERLIAIQDESGVTTNYRTVRCRFEDAVNFMVTEGSTCVHHMAIGNMALVAAITTANRKAGGYPTLSRRD